MGPPVARWFGIGLTLGLLASSILASSGTSAENTDLVPESDRDLAARYAPILYLDPAEIYWPTDVRAILDHATFWRDSTKVEGPPVPSDTLRDRGDSSASVRLALEGRSPRDAYVSYRFAYDNITYSRIVHRADGSRIVQYWLFYVFNDGVNDHEGDWEMIQVHLDDDMLPVRATYSQHNTGRSRHWSEVPRSGSHPHVFIAFGSHASYFTAGSHSLSSDPCGLTGLDTTSDKIVLKPDAGYRLEMLGAQPWLTFEGRWGAPGSAEFSSGPRGPPHRTSGCNVSLWDDPVLWSEMVPTERLGPWIAPYDAPPLAVAGPDLVVHAREAVTLDGSASRDPEGDVVSFQWVFGDGTSGVGEVVDHTYDSPGIFTVILSVTDELGQSASDSLEVAVLPNPSTDDGDIAVGAPPPTPTRRSYDDETRERPSATGSGGSWLPLLSTEAVLAGTLIVLCYFGRNGGRRTRRNP